MLTVLTGRSRRLWPRVVREIGESHAAKEGRLLLLVPGQFTLQAELELVDRLDLPGFFDLDVLSPSRLMTRVFTLAGSPQRVRIDGRGKAMMLADVLLASRKTLAYYGGAAGRRGFADRLSACIGDFKRAGMKPADVYGLSEKLADGDALADKLRDMALLYERYEERLADTFLDDEDAQEALLQRLPGSGLLDGSRVWIYGFDLISPQFLRQITAMAVGAQSVRLALTLEDASAPDGAAFTPARDTLARLARHFDRERLAWDRVHVDAPLMADPAIQYLERELFALKSEKSEPFAGDDSPVTLWAAHSPYDEAASVAAEMLEYARQGMPFEEMAVVVGDAEAYEGALATAFERAGVPYHLARKRPAIAHPLLRAWLAALRCITLGWRMEDALEWLKGGFSSLSRDEMERLENYALENGLQGAKWRKPIADTALDACRERFAAPLLALQKRLREARDGTATLAAAFGFLEDVDAYATLETRQRELAARGLNTEAADCAQAWRLALETLDQLHALLRGRRQPMASIAQVMEAGLGQAELGALPATPGAAQVGQLGHVKLGGTVKILFLMGMVDGVMRPEDASLLSGAEAARASQAAGQDAAFGLHGDALAQLMQINLLDTLAAPSERLYISHSMVSAAKEAQRPAAVLKLVRKVFPDMKERGKTTVAATAWHAREAALDALGPSLRAAAGEAGELNGDLLDAAAWLLSSPETRGRAEGILRRLVSPAVQPALRGKAAANLFAHIPTSVSRLEAFSRCPYEHFVRYGIRPMPRKAYDIRRDETGTFYHRAIEAYSLLAAGEPDWPDIARERSDALMNEALAPLVKQWEDAPINDNAMQRAEGEAFCRIARRAAWNYAVQLRRGAFRTRLVEARFGPGEALPPIKLLLDDGRACWVEGRIDRIDFFAEGSEAWLRVVDYKSGSASLTFSRLYGGLQLQLMLYLAAALQAFPEIRAAGAFYSRFHDPFVETDSRDIAEIEQLLAKELRLKGLALSDVRVVLALEDGKLNKDGTPGIRGAIDEDDMAALMRHAHALAQGIAGRIAAGEIQARPAQLGQWRACAYCDYLSVCGFDPAREGHTVRRVENLTQEEVLERVR